MKKIDQLLISSFIGPFIVTFFIALFVLIMQALWLNIEKIIGKGADFFLIMEMVGYMAISLFPLALPLATLISSIMVLGNLAERYELVTMKSAGISLWRILQPLMAVAALIVVFSFICSNYFIPVTNLKFQSRLHDLKHQKPTLNIEEGVFNYDFDNFVIRVEEKESDNKSIKGVLIIDQKKAKNGKVSEVFAETGEMFTTENKRFFVMHLQDGVHYEEPDNQTTGDNRRGENYAFVRTHFKEWDKVFDLSEFDIDWTDQERFKTHYKMLSVEQLRDAIDTLAIDIQNRKDGLSIYIDRFIEINEIKKIDSLERSKDSLSTPIEEIASVQKTPPDSVSKIDTLSNPPDSVILVSPDDSFNTEVDAFPDTLKEYATFLESLPKISQQRVINRTKSSLRSVLAQAESSNRILKKKYEIWVKTIIEMHNKFTMAAICFVFLFIGAPMGAIIRKGGFGYPILISIIFFVLFMVLNIFFKNVAEKGAMNPDLAAWAPILVLTPIGAWLTYRAIK